MFGRALDDGYDDDDGDDQAGAIHSSTFQLNLSRFPLTTIGAFLQKRLYRAEMWTSVAYIRPLFRST